VIPNGLYVSSFSPLEPMLAPLADNGGPTFTYAIPESSPAAGANGDIRDRNPFNDCPTLDQRGVPRALGDCDLGAFQVKPGLPGYRRPFSRTAVFSGRLSMLVRCPARHRPVCRITVVALTLGRDSEAAGPAKTVRIRPGKKRSISLAIEPGNRRHLADLTHPPGGKVLVKQTIRSKRIGKRRAKRPTASILAYSVRSYDPEGRRPSSP
jgi:hypothetical protein